MYLNIQNVILMTICLRYPYAFAQQNGIKNISSRNSTSSLPKESMEKYTGIPELTTDFQSHDHLSIHFASRGTDLITLNISDTNNDQGIDILKADSIFWGDSKTVVTDDKFEASKNAIKIEYIGNADTTRNTTNVINNTTHENKLEETNHKSTENETALTGLSTLYANNEDAIEILKDSTSTLMEADNNNATIADKFKLEQDMKGIVIESSENLNKSVDINHSINKDFHVNSNKNTSTENQTPFVLSELINLSLSEGDELALGQKIQMERSSMNSETQDTNSVGMEILKNISTTCGSLFGKRISFANETTLMEFPWTALLIYNTNIRYHCGGSLITRKYVLTAAHCVAQQFYELIGVRLGEHDISEPVDCAPDIAGDKICASTVDVTVVKIIVHHEYSHLSFKNDIALLRLDNDYIGRSFYPICIPLPDMMYGARQATVAGWGATEKAIRSTVLLKADVPIYDISKCREIYSYNVFNDSTEICGSGANEVDVCKGDSGGALFYEQYVKGKSRFYQLGIISLGVRRCGDSRFLPAVFTKLNGFYKWIENNLEY